MTFRDIKTGRVIQAVAFTFGLSLVLYFLISCAAITFVPEAMINRLQTVSEDYINSPASNSEQQAELENELRDIFEDYQGEIIGLFVLFALQAFILLGVAFWFARRAAQEATSQAQAGGYGMLVGLGVAMVLGTVCLLINPATLFIGCFYMILVIGAAFFGGRMAGRQMGKAKHYPQPELGAQMPAGMLSAVPDGDPEVYYNMGVAAAMGGRREEARQHFSRVLQFQPRNTAAWLQLANLADTPQQAWNYVQQARSISPNDPAVVQAVNIIWPQVQAEASQEPPRNQPPYRGGAMDDPDIPRTTLPGPDDDPDR